MRTQNDHVRAGWRWVLTNVELVIVIVVIGLLVGVALPGVSVAQFQIAGTVWGFGAGMIGAQLGAVVSARDRAQACTCCNGDPLQGPA